MENEEKVEEMTEETKENIDVKEACEPEEKVKKCKKDKKQEKIDSLENENKELKDKLLRNVAELENFKRRMNDERIKDRKYASFDLVSDLIGIIANLDKCVNIETEDLMLKNFLVGFKMIDNQLIDRLKEDGLEEIKAEVGMKFDPNIHHAVEAKENEGAESETICEVVMKGYKYKDRIIKPAMVKVNK